MTYQSMRTDLWGSRKGILIVWFLLSKLEQRSLNVAASSCGGDTFKKASRVDVGIFLYIWIKKDAFYKLSGYVWTRLIGGPLYGASKPPKFALLPVNRKPFSLINCNRQFSSVE